MVFASWQKNLYIIFAAEFLVITAFSFTDPFMPLFIQELGGYTVRQAAFWTGIASGGSGIAMFLTSPLWGMVADRWGRKPMVLRAMFGGAVVLAAMGLVPNVYYLIVLRWLQGLVTGTIAASSALVAAVVPRNKISFAIGLIIVAMFGGSSLGPLIGGFLADTVGYRTTFFIIGSILLLGGLIVFLFVKERFEPPAEGQRISLSSIGRVAISRDMFPLLIALFILGIGPSMIAPIIPLFIGELNPGGLAATAAGLTFSFMGAASAVSAVVAGRLGERLPLRRMMVFSCLGTGLLYLPPMWATTVAQVLLFMALTGLLRGGVSTSSNALVGLSALQSQQGIAYGLSHSAGALGNGIGPLIGGSLASFMGLRVVFGFTGGLFALAGIFIAWLLREQPLKRT